MEAPISKGRSTEKHDHYTKGFEDRFCGARNDGLEDKVPDEDASQLEMGTVGESRFRVPKSS